MVRINRNLNKLEYFDKADGTSTVIGDLITPVAILLPLDFDESPLVTFRVSRLIGTGDFQLKMTDLSSVPDMTKSLFKKNYIYNSVYGYQLMDYLIREIQVMASDTSKQHYAHRSLGFQTWNEERMFLLASNTLSNGVVSTYSNPKFQFTKGSEEAYQVFLKEQIIPYKTTQIALVLGLSSVVASYLKEYANVPTIVLNLNGASSTGKTTMAQFIASLWASPVVNNHSIVKTFNGTFNSIMASIEGINGVPIILDDATAGGSSNKTSMLYTLAQGESKGRATSEGRLVEGGRSWSGLIIITSETAILSEAETRQGLMARVIETKDTIWTSSAEHSETITQFISNHYGFIGQRFVREFLNLSETKIQAIYESSKKIILKKMKNKDGLSNRIANKLAIILSTAVLVKKLLEIEEINLPEITDMLIGFDQTDVEQRHIGEKGHQAIKLFITNNFGKFLILNSDGHYIDGSIKSSMGYIKFVDKDTMTATIASENVKKILSDNLIYEYKPVLAYWSKHKLIKQGEEKRNTVKDHRLSVRAVKFIFKRDQDMMIPWLSDLKKSPLSNEPMLVHEQSYDDHALIDEIFQEDEGKELDRGNTN
jgi:hypothetical protein